jgi:hypothetical protein
MVHGRKLLSMYADRLCLDSSIDTAANRCFCTEAVMQRKLLKIATIVHLQRGSWRERLQDPIIREVKNNNFLKQVVKVMIVRH